MDGFGECSDHPSSFGSLNLVSGDWTQGAAHSDEGVLLLATSRPKRRAGRRIFRETRHPVYRGVRRRNGDKWVCEMREPSKSSRIWLGTYPTPEMAARAHDVAALALRGKFACLNFADSAWKLPAPVSENARDIRRAASEAAEMFRPRECEYSREETIPLITSVKDSIQACSEDSKTLQQTNSTMFYMDEEAIFDMPGLLVDMAGGLLLSPPHYPGDGSNWDFNEDDFDLTLWNHM